MNQIKPSVLLALALLLGAGCATTQSACDPARADFYNNTSCLASGTYDARQRRLESELARERSRNQAFRTVLAALDEEKEEVRSGLTSSQSRYANLDRAWGNLRQDLQQGQRENETLARQIAGIDKQMARRKNAGPVGIEQKVRQRDDLQRRLSLLQQEIDAGLYE